MKHQTKLTLTCGPISSRAPCSNRTLPHDPTESLLSRDAMGIANLLWPVRLSRRGNSLSKGAVRNGLDVDEGNQHKNKTCKCCVSYLFFNEVITVRDSPDEISVAPSTTCFHSASSRSHALLLTGGLHLPFGDIHANRQKQGFRRLWSLLESMVGRLLPRATAKAVQLQTKQTHSLDY